jgi:hypothetical protein
MLGSFALNYHCNPMEVLDMTMQNLSLFNSVVPCYDDEKEQVINGDSIKNQDKINEILRV